MLAAVYRPRVRFIDELFIAAPAETVWTITADLENLPAVTPTMTSVELLDGSLRIGSRVRITQPRTTPGTWTVTVLDQGRELAWARSAGTARLVAAHRLTPMAGGTINTLTVNVQGPGARLVAALIGPQLRRYLATENESIRRVAEQGVVG